MHIKTCLKYAFVLLKLQDYFIQPLRSFYAYSTCKINVILNTCALHVYVIHNVSCVFQPLMCADVLRKFGIRIYVISVMSYHKFWSVEIVYSQYWRKVCKSYASVIFTRCICRYFGFTNRSFRSCVIDARNSYDKQRNNRSRFTNTSRIVSPITTPGSVAC